MSETAWFILALWIVLLVLSLLFRKVTILHVVAGIIGMFFGLSLIGDANPLLKFSGLGVLVIGLYWVLDVLIFHKVSEE